MTKLYWEILTNYHFCIDLEFQSDTGQRTRSLHGSVWEYTS